MPTRAITDADIRRYHDEGCLILRGAFNPRRVAQLRDGVERIMDAASAGKLEIGWLDRAKRLPNRISGVLHPEKYQDAFGAWLDEDLDPQIRALCGGPARHSLFGMLAGGAGLPYLQGWHRDIGKPGAPDEEAFLRHHHGRFVQFNAPLQPRDRFLQIVPASHLRASTPAEIKASQRPGFKRADETTPVSEAEVQAILEHDRIDAMPGAMTVEMEPGDIAYYNANLWHRGWNPRGELRWTMHSAFWKVGYPVMAHEYGQREPMLTPGHLDRLPPATRGYVQRYLDAYPTGKPKSLLEV